MRQILIALSVAVAAATPAPATAAELLVEAEGFAERGGWKLDTQFVEIMGSPYLLAHGLGRPVKDAVTTVEFPAAGTYRVFVRTKDWVARWNAPGQPGRFQLLVNGKQMPEQFGTSGADWHWQDGGRVKVDAGRSTLTLRDLTGYNGRCDAVYFTTDATATPPNEREPLGAWRKKTLGLPDAPVEESGYDLVVVGGGYSGMGAAISAARMGCKVALIQNRAVLGGNGSSEVRVWSKGYIRRGRYPRIGEIVEEFADNASKSPGKAEEFGDAHKEKVVRAEKNIKLFLNHHANVVETKDSRVVAVTAFDTRTSQQRRFTGKLFVDCTGHGTIGFLAGADHDMTEKGHMGMSNMWTWAEKDSPQPFPTANWALDLEMADFPYPRRFHGEWFWETGFNKHPVDDLELMRDWNLRAVFGAWNAMKNKGGAEKHRNAVLTWIAYIGGPRESRRIMGDVVLTQDDIVAKRDFPDGCVPSTWTIDLHYPKKQYAVKFPDDPFIAIAKHDKRIDRRFGYPVPYRCFYSRNIENLFMAGRCISVTHEALGTVRVMRTCGMMGEVVGKAASICVKEACTPREVYAKHLKQLDTLLKLPGKARRATVQTDSITIPKDIPTEAGPYGTPSGLNPAKLAGIVIDDDKATKTGKWGQGAGLKGYVGYQYLYAGGGSGAAIRFDFKAPKAGRYEVRYAYQPHPNRAKAVPVVVRTPAGVKTVTVNMQAKPPVNGGFISLGVYQLAAGAKGAVEVSTKGVTGNVHADAVQVLPAK